MKDLYDFYVTWVKGSAKLFWSDNGRRPVSSLGVRWSHFQTTSPLKSQDRFHPNFIWSIDRSEKRMFVKVIFVHWPKWLPYPYMILALQKLLQNLATGIVKRPSFKCVQMILGWPLTICKDFRFTFYVYVGENWKDTPHLLQWWSLSLDYLISVSEEIWFSQWGIKFFYVKEDPFSGGLRKPFLYELFQKTSYTWNMMGTAQK